MKSCRNLCDYDYWGEGGKKVATKEKRWYKDVGLGFKTPSEAIHGTYIGMSIHSSHLLSESLWLCFFSDKKCPFTGNVSIRGRILTGKVVSTKMTRTIVIRRDYLHYIPKYSALAATPLTIRKQTIFNRPLREETQEHGRSCIARFPCRAW